jgi:hypothetical protein
MVSLLANKFVNYMFPALFVKPINFEQKIVAGVSKFFWDYILFAADYFVGLSTGCIIFLCAVSLYYNYRKKSYSSDAMGAIFPATMITGFYLFTYGLIIILPIVIFRIISANYNETLEIMDFGRFTTRDL